MSVKVNIMNTLKFYIDGKWIEPNSTERTLVISPATEEIVAEIAIGDEVDANRSVAAAKRAFVAFSKSSRNDRLELLHSIAEIYEKRKKDIADALVEECGFPFNLAHGAQVDTGSAHFATMIDVLARYPFEELRGSTLVRREPIGVCALITPWNWPLNQIVCKVAPAIAAGCTMVLKPSELSPLNALIFAEIMDEAGVPPGVFNLVNGTGPVVGANLASHPDVDMVSFTGSTSAGVEVARAAAFTVKRVHQELGGKSPFIVMPDADLRKAVSDAVDGCFLNAGQSCNAPTRLLVERKAIDKVEKFAVEAVSKYKLGHPMSPETTLGPVISSTQKNKIEELIKSGIDEGATLLCGGLSQTGRPERGYYVNPTVFSNITSSMRLFREEVFGPVLTISIYDTVDEAIELANDTLYGLAAYVHGKDVQEVNRISYQLRVGDVHINSPAWDPYAPFGGYKMSGNGREYAEFGLADFLEIKGIIGYGGR